jgi:aspartate kinase
MEKHQRNLRSYEFKLKVIQNTAISFAVCVEDKFDNFKSLNSIVKKI